MEKDLNMEFFEEQLLLTNRPQSLTTIIETSNPRKLLRK
jgi:hypothetical protein